MFKRRHGTGVNIQIRICQKKKSFENGEWSEEVELVRERVGTDFDGSDAEATGFEDDADATGGDAFAEAANDSAGDENVLHFLGMNEL